MPNDDQDAVPTERNPNPFTVIDITDDGHEFPVAIRNPNGGMLILTVKASRGTLTAILPSGGVVREVEDTGEVVMSWRVGGT